MTDVQTYELKDMKLSLAVRRGKENPSWTVRLNDKWVYGGEKASYHLAVKAYDTVERAIDIIARSTLGYTTCNHCNLLVPSTVQTMVWYTDEDTDERSGFTEKICETCKIECKKEGNLEK